MKKDLTRELRKKYIIEIVKEYWRQYPVEAKSQWAIIKHVRKVQRDEFASDGMRGSWPIRHVFTIPAKLHGILTKNLNNPRFLEEDREMVWFWRTFKEFRASEKI